MTIYTGPKEMVNAQLVHVHHNRWDVRLSGELPSNVETLYATFWLSPAPVNCHVRLIDAHEDPATGEICASFNAVDLSLEERKRITTALLGLDDYVRLRNAS